MAKIGFVGYFSADKFDKNDAQKIINEIFFNLSKNIDKEDIAIVSGATYYGIVKLVYDKAAEYDLKTIGVMCKDGYNYDLYPCDEIYAVGNNWGDESKTFINMIDILYRIGGGTQSQNEVKMAKKRGIQVFEFELPKIKE